MYMSMSFMVLLFQQSIADVNGAVKKREVKVVQSYTMKNLIGLCVQFVAKV